MNTVEKFQKDRNVSNAGPNLEVKWSKSEYCSNKMLSINVQHSKSSHHAEIKSADLW